MKKNKIAFSIILILLIISMFSMPTNVFAKTVSGGTTTGLQKTTTSVTQHSAEEIVKEADGFLDKATTDDQISEENLKNMSDTIYSILLILGIIIAFAIGGILGIKFVLGGLEEKAQIKAMIIPYIAGLAVLFGAFTIWKIVVTILQS